MSKATDAYVQAIRTRLDRLESSAPSLDAAAALMADAALNGWRACCGTIRQPASCVTRMPAIPMPSRWPSVMG
ncbi:hypothetical protein SODG_002324 [Sodalis praecaptivus]|nr:hypothetical protein NVIRENTERO_03678 [Sodalis praecaptivus]